MLPEEKRQQLDGILTKMTQNGESDDAINFVVNDFKNKYSIQEQPKSFREKTASALDMIFGGGKVGEAIGTKIAEMRAKPEEKQFITPGPSAGEVAGSALQSAALFIPGGAGAKAITSVATKAGLKTGASALGKIGAGMLAGESFDVATNLQQGKTGKDVLTPGLGTFIGGAIPAAGVAKNVMVRFGDRQAPRVINSLIKPLQKDFAYGKNPGRAIAEEGIVANNFDDLINGIRTSRQRIGQEIGNIGDKLSTQPRLNIRQSLSPLDEAAKIATSQNNPTLLARIGNVKRAITDVLEPVVDDAGNLTIKSVGGRDLENLTFKQARSILSDIGDLTAFTGNPSDDKLVNSALKQVYGKMKEETLKVADNINPVLAKDFRKLTEKYADLTSAEIATKYRDKIVERQALVGLSPQTIGIGTGLITAVATGGATLPAVLAGLTGATLDKLASTPAFKTRLAYLLSTKTQNEANYLFRKIPALSKFFNTKAGLTPGDVVLGKGKQVIETAKTIPNKQAGMIKGGNESDSLLQEARKYKSGEDFYEKSGGKINNMLREKGIRGKEQVTKYWEEITGQKSIDSYAMSHRPTESGALASDISKGGEFVLEDVYQHPEWYFNMNQPDEYGIATRESFNAVKKLKGKPNAEVTIYRASPSTKLNNGDWVTLSKKYAEIHAGDKMPVNTFKVKAKDIQFAGDDINEFGYFGKSQLTDIWKKAQGQAGFAKSPLVVGASALGAGAGIAKIPGKKETYEAPKTAQTTPQVSPKVDYKKEISFRETGSLKGDTYKTIRKNTNGTYDIGKYQINTAALKAYGDDFLGRVVTSKELLASPELQEKFIEGYLKKMQAEGIKDKDLIIAMWHRGWGNRSKERLAKLKNEPLSKKYLNNRPAN